MPAFTVGTPQDLTYERVDGDCVPTQNNVSVRQRWNQRHDGNDNGSTDSLHAVLQVGLSIAQPRARSSQAHARSSGRYLLNAGSRANRGKPVTQPRVTQPFRRWASGDEAAWEELVPLVEADLHQLAQLWLLRALDGEAGARDVAGKESA